MKKRTLLLMMSCLLSVSGLCAAGQKFMACLNKKSNGKIIKYGQKRGDLVSHDRCKGLWDKHSYQHGNVAVCQLKRHGRDLIDFYGRVHCPDDQKVSDACQKAYPLQATAMHSM